jgi:O-antigen ligase
VAPALRPFAPAALLAALMVMVLTGRLHDALLYGKLPVAKIFLAVGALFFFMSNGAAALQAALKTLPGRGFLALSAAVFASVPFSVLKSHSFEVALAWLYSNVPIFIIVATALRSIGDLERVLRALILMVLASAAIILAGMGIVEYGPEGARVSLAGSYDPNDFAAVIAASSAACLWALRGKPWLWKLLGALGLLASGYLVVKTGSRGGGLSLGLLLVGSALFVPNLMTRTARLGVLVALVVGAASAPSSFTERMASLADVGNDYNVTSRSGRVEVWKRGLSFVVRSPAVGVGAGAYPIADGRWAEEHGETAGFKWSAAHNLLLETAAETGLPGFVALLCCLLPAIVTWRRIRKLSPTSDTELRLQRAIEALALLTLTYLLAATFVNGLYNPLVTMITALSVAAHVLLSQSSLAASSGRGPLPAGPGARKVGVPQSKPRRAAQ